MASSNGNPDVDGSVLKILDLTDFNLIEDGPCGVEYRVDGNCDSPEFEYRNYAAEFVRLENELGEMREKAKESDQQIAEMTKKLEEYEKVTSDLKCSINQQQKNLTATQNSLIKEAKSLMTWKRVIDTEKQKNKNILGRNLNYLEICRLQNDIKRMQKNHTEEIRCLKVSQKQKLMSYNKQIQTFQRNTLDYMDKFEKASKKIAELESEAEKSKKLMAEKELENKRLVCALIQEERDKNLTVNLWERLNDTVKSISDEFEADLHLLVKTFHLKDPAEYKIVQENEGDDAEPPEGIRLQRNLYLLSLLTRDTLQKFIHGKEEPKDDEDHTLQEQPATSNPTWNDSDPSHIDTNDDNNGTEPQANKVESGRSSTYNEVDEYIMKNLQDDNDEQGE